MMGNSRRRASGGISLFPILAVLICTLGALIVLLMVVVHQAKVQAHTISAAGSAAARSPSQSLSPEELARLREQEEDARWRTDLLRQQRDELTKKLADQRLELSHLEDHIRRIEDQGNLLQQQAQEFDRLGKMNEQQRAAAKAELDALRASLDQSRNDLETARKEASSRPRSYAIIPYEGPHGVRRRPIYVECTDLGVILQPEGLVLTPSDFSGPMGPGNPLDAAFLAVREYWTNQGLTQPGEAYPLLIVRPDGAVAYAMCRMAMKSWEDGFGYELIDAELKLAYPPPDPALKTILERAIGDARQRQAVLAMAAPSRYRIDRPGAMRASSSGGFVSQQEGGRGAGGGEAGRARGGRGVGAGTGDGNGVSAPERFSDQAAPGDAFDPHGGGDGSLDVESGQGGAPGAMARGAGRGKGGAAAGGGAGARGTGARGTGTAAGDGSTAGYSAAGGSAAGYAAGGPPPGPGQAGQGGSPPSGGGQAGASGGANGGANAGAYAQYAGQGASAGGYASNGPPPGMMTSESGDVAPLAETRGANWGLPDDSNKATGFTRPIRLVVQADRLVLYPERGDGRQPQVIDLPASTRDGVDELMQGIWKQVRLWGIAGRRAYWKPVLRIEVAPGADARYRDLEVLLRGSGIDIERKP